MFRTRLLLHVAYFRFKELSDFFVQHPKLASSESGTAQLWLDMPSSMFFW